MSTRYEHNSAVKFDGSLRIYQDYEIVQSRHTAKQEIFDWCAEHELNVDLLWGWFHVEDNVASTWGIADAKQRTMFALRWA
jgi:hypothetical protein